MQTCSLGFIFDTELAYVLLIHKNRPAWQAGYINGVGGKVEPNETSVACMVRECQEETSLAIPEAAWKHFATLIDKDGMNSKNHINPGAHIHVFVAQYQGEKNEATKNDHEEIEWFPIHNLPDNVISNLHFLVPMAREILRGHDSKQVTIEY